MTLRFPASRTSRLALMLIAALTLPACEAARDPDETADAGTDPSAYSNGQPASSEDQGSSDSTEDGQANVMDLNGFGSPIVAINVQLPAGWRTQGGVTWDRSSECVGNYLRFKWLATSRNGRDAFEMMPGYTWQLQGTQIPMNPCPALAVRTAREFLEIVAQRYPGVKILNYRDRPDLRTTNQQTMPGVRATSEAGEMLISYSSGKGEIREMLTTTLNITELQGNVMVGVPNVHAVRSTRGDPDMKTAERIRKSMVPDERWMQMMKQSSQEAIARISQNQQARIAAWHASEMSKISARGAAERSRIAMQTSREVAQIYSNTWANSQATDDRIQRRTLEAIGGYNTYVDPAAGGLVRESIDYDRVLRTESGGYISTNDPNFNPAGTQELDRLP